MNGPPCNLDDLVHVRAIESNRRELRATWSAPAADAKAGELEPGEPLFSRLSSRL
jgi:hypothetical protein